jgi:hypothetical protein
MKPPLPRKKNWSGLGLNGTNKNQKTNLPGANVLCIRSWFFIFAAKVSGLK